MIIAGQVKYIYPFSYAMMIAGQVKYIYPFSQPVSDFGVQVSAILIGVNFVRVLSEIKIRSCS
jgi:hypothetical protein